MRNAVFSAVRTVTLRLLVIQLSFHVSHSQICHVKLILRRVLVSLVIYT